jgi:hypothetical protein
MQPAERANDDNGYSRADEKVTLEWACRLAKSAFDPPKLKRAYLSTRAFMYWNCMGLKRINCKFVLPVLPSRC